jgi:hypothetical protein
MLPPLAYSVDIETLHIVIMQGGSNMTGTICV